MCVWGGAAGYLPQWAHGGRKHTIKLAKKSPQREGDQPHHGCSHHFAHLKRSGPYKIRESTSPQKERKAWGGLAGKAVPATITLMHSPLQLKPDAWELGLSVGEITDPWGCSCDVAGDFTRAQ